MSVFRLALGLAAATAAAVMVSNSRKKAGGYAEQSLPNMDRGAGPDRWSGAAVSGDAGRLGSTSALMSSTDHEDLLVPPATDEEPGGSLTNTPDRSGVM